MPAWRSLLPRPCRLDKVCFSACLILDIGGYLRERRRRIAPRNDNLRTAYDGSWTADPLAAIPNDGRESECSSPGPCIVVAPEVTIELEKATLCSARGGRSDRRLLIAERNPHVGVGLRLAFHELIAGL
jgi:hypothetical protein